MLATMRLALVTLGLLLVTSPLPACSKGPSRPTQKVPAEMTRCQSDADCTLVTMSCCDSCNGGWEWSVAVAAAGEAKSRFGEPCTESQYCTDLGCMPEPVAICDNNVCATRRGDSIEHNEIREKK
jgi:hypothetical protein